jgi:peptidoglycan/xylan/chitin deacetylase (PgdA/CDA1 family)
MLKVLVTIDTETHPITGDWRQTHLTGDMKRDVYGQIDGHAVGLEYQLNTLSKHGLKASFMVESLFAAVPEVGEQPLRDIVRAIISAGHDVQLHPHPEWIAHLPDLHVPYRSHLLSNYSLAEQAAVMRYASHRLEQAGAPRPVAFRAGGFAANTDTLLALERCGVRYDSSYNKPYLGDRCRQPQPKFVGHITEYNGVQELPVAVFQDFMGHLRPAQLCACSADEMTHALISAEAAGWDFFVIVSHSFEMLARRRHPSKPPVIRWDVVDRFERLCQFLGANADRFPTIRFADLDKFNSLHMPDAPEVSIKGKFLNTVSRIAQQALSRIQTH